VLTCVAVVCLIGLWVISDGGELADRAENMGASVTARGKEDMATHVERQRQANDDLRSTIELLKNQTAFVLFDKFNIPPNERQPGGFFNERFIEVREKLREIAYAKRIDYDQNMGFDAKEAVPSDESARFLLTMLQVKEKVVGIALETPMPLEKIRVTHAPAIQTGPVTRPALVREYPITLQVRGGHQDILWILHRISQVHEPKPGEKRQDYPLILRGLTITSENATPKDNIPQIEAVFDLAAMKFLTEEERALDPLASQSSFGGEPRVGASGGKPVFRARP
jgi:hypothetical protein